jgi:zinc protease
MVHTIMTAAETDSERTVIISERHMYENQPMFLLYEEVQAAAFRVHPYHHEVIGDEIDLETMSRDDLYRFYRRHYAPNNATIVVVGDFETEKMLASITSYFGDIRPQESPDPVVRQEPPQKGERQTTVRGPGETAYLMYAYKAPAATHPDYFPLALLNAAFSGGGSLGMFGSSTSNKSSRLYRALVSAELAVGVSGGITPTIDPFLYNILAIVRPGVPIGDVETALDAEIDRLKTEPLTQDELDKALKRAKVQFVQASESITGQAQMIGMSEAVVGDYQWFETALDKLAAVTLDDIERVRDTYLRKDNRTIGRYLPA